MIISSSRRRRLPKSKTLSAKTGNATETTRSKLSPHTQRHTAFCGHDSRCAGRALQCLGDLLNASLILRHRFQKFQIRFGPCATYYFFLPGHISFLLWERPYITSKRFGNEPRYGERPSKTAASSSEHPVISKTMSIRKVGWMQQSSKRGHALHRILTLGKTYGDVLAASVIYSGPS
jgi:hypothetical protein